MKICLIVTGGIAAVKIYDLVRIIRHKGHEIDVVLTSSAKYFVTEMALTILTGNKVYTDLFDLETEVNIGHIDISRKADLILIAPATANIISKIANGISDDLATTLLLAAKCPIYIAPAMNAQMWENSFFQENIKKLEDHRQYNIISPTHGLMACGEIGEGRMAEPQQIYSFIASDFTKTELLSGKKILITAGPTREKIDPVRYISNFSSGKQGYLLAKIAMSYGAEVHLVSGPTSLTTCALLYKIESAYEMFDITQNILLKHDIDIAICAAAVSDWKPKYHDKKQKKKSNVEKLSIEMSQNPDILASITAHKKRPKFVAGFAAETDNIEKNALQKLHKKECDVIFMNDVSRNIFGSDETHVIAYDLDQITDFGQCSKELTSYKIIDYIINNL